MHIVFGKLVSTTDFVITIGENTYKANLGDTIRLQQGNLVLNDTGQSFLEKLYVLRIRSKEAMFAEIKTTTALGLTERKMIMK